MAENEVTKSIKSTLAKKLGCYEEANNSDAKTKDYFGSNGIINNLFISKTVKTIKTLGSCQGENFGDNQVNYCSKTELTWWQAYLLKKFDEGNLKVVKIVPGEGSKEYVINEIGFAKSKKIARIDCEIVLDKNIIKKITERLYEITEKDKGAAIDAYEQEAFEEYKEERLKKLAAWKTNPPDIIMYPNITEYNGYYKLNLYSCYFKNDDEQILREIIDYDNKTHEITKEITSKSICYLAVGDESSPIFDFKKNDDSNVQGRKRIENISSIGDMQGKKYYLSYVKYITTDKDVAFPFKGENISSIIFGFEPIEFIGQKNTDTTKELVVPIKENENVIPTIYNKWYDDEVEVCRYYSYDLQNLSPINENKKKFYVFKKILSLPTTAGGIVSSGQKKEDILRIKEIKNDIIYITSDKIPVKEGDDYWADHFEGNNQIYYLSTEEGSQNCAYEVKFKTKAEGETEYKEITKYYTKMHDKGNDVVNSWGMYGDWVVALMNWGKRTNSEYNKEENGIEIATGSTVNSNSTLYQEYYAKRDDDDERIGTIPNLYIQKNTIKYRPRGATVLGEYNTEPIEYGDGVLNTIFSDKGLENLEKDEAIITTFYTDGDGVVTYGAGCTFSVYNPMQKNIWSAFIRNCYDKGIYPDAGASNYITEKGLHEFLPENWSGSWRQGSYRLIGTNDHFYIKGAAGNPIRVIPNAGIYGSLKRTKSSDLAGGKAEYSWNNYTTQNPIFDPIYIKKATSYENFKVHCKSPNEAYGEINSFTNYAMMEKAKVLFGHIQAGGGAIGNFSDNETELEKVKKWCLNPSYRSDAYKPLTQEQWELLLSVYYNGVPRFNPSKTGKSFSSIFIREVKSYKELCTKIYNFANNGQTTYTSKNAFRGARWRTETFLPAFNPSKINPTPATDSKGDEVIREIFGVSIRCFALNDLTIFSRVKVKERNDTTFTKELGYDSTVNENNNYAFGRMFDFKVKEEDEALSSGGGGGNGGPSKEELNWENVKETIDKWTCKLGNNTEPKEQYLVDVNRYYDFYSEMAPYIELAFRKYDSSGNKGWNVINSIKHPYIKNLFVEDKGVKTATITLFDKDFNSYQKGILTSLNEPRGNGNEKECVYSLESLIRSSLISMDITTGETDKKELKYNEDIINTTEQLKDSFIKFVEDAQASDPTNLCIRFGYCDLNQTFHMKTEGDIVRSTDEASVKMINYFEKEKNATKRNARWWQFKNDTTVRTISAIPNFVIRGNSLESNDGKFELSSLGDQIITTDKDEGNRDVKLNGVDQTTLITPYRMYMIVGYETKLQTNGILYTIKAIESTLGETLRKRFLQRYSEITSYPLEILYILIKIFNESYTGEINKNSKIKIYYLDDLGKGTDGFNMLFDFSGMDPKEAQKFGEIKDYYYSRNVKVETIDKKWLKKASIRFGTEEALSRNSSRNEGKPNLYKNVSSLINEFCAICPARKEWDEAEEELKAYDGNGNEVIGDKYKSSAPLGWFVARLGKNGASKDEKLDNETYIVLYYKKPVKLGKIRLYRWGPALTGKTVVRSIDVKNNNEFAILSGVNSFSNVPNGVKQSIKLNYNNIGSGTKPVKENAAGQMSSTISSDKLNEEYEKNNGMILTGYVNPTEIQANKFDAAFSSSMYTGSITLLGDPCLEFDMTIQPYCYPIRLEVVVPYNETYFRDVQVRQEINKGEFGHQFPYGSTGRYHEITRYYVITSITHNIGIDGGYTTTLGISSYPGIENDILINPNASTKLPIL
jgi:hypothetical protein